METLRDNNAEIVLESDEGDSKCLVSVIVLSYNNKAHLERCLLSLLNQTFQDFELIFVDNASLDGSYEKILELKRNYNILDLKIVKSTKNLGYCTGNNIGARMCKGKYVAFLNADTCVKLDWLEHLVSNIESDNSIGIVGSKVLLNNGKIQAYGLAFDRYGCVKLIGLLERDAEQTYYCKPFSHSGASFLVRKDIFNYIGRLDDKLFLYCDELDLAWRVRLLGYKVQINPSSTCYHYETSRINLLKFYFYWRNRIRILVKNYSFPNVFRYAIPTIFLVVLESVYLSVKLRKTYLFQLMIKGILWNLRNLKDTLMKRMEAQKMRKVEDDVILKNMIPYPKEIIERHEFFKYQGQASNPGFG